MNMLANFIEMCKTRGVPDEQLIKIRTIESQNTSLDITLSFGDLKANFDEHKIY